MFWAICVQENSCGSEGVAPHIPIGGEWSASRPGRLTIGERAAGTHRIGDWVCPTAVVDTAAIVTTPVTGGN